VKPSKVTIVAAIITIVGLSLFGLKQYRCKQRNGAFAQQIERIKQAAREGLKIGTKKAEIARFFADHSIPFTTVGSEAFGTPEALGTLRTSGCSPFGCGSDVAFINVRVKLDDAGTVAEEPTVVGMYTDCL
jgi:hypothetical protein